MNLGAGGVYWSENNKKLTWQSGGIIYAEVTMPNESRVLEVGSGQDPHPGADVFVDKFVDDNDHRMARVGILRQLNLLKIGTDGSQVDEIRPIEIQEADISALPFRDKEFDFVITKHILEHVPDLRAALKELGRVARNGFIEVPRMSSEMLFPQGEIHRWTFDDFGGKLTARSVVGFQSPFGRIMHTLFAERKDIRDAWSKAYLHFHVVKVWENYPECEIIG